MPECVLLFRWNLCLNELSKQRERFLPAEIAGLGGNNIRDSLLDDVELRSTGHLLQGNRRLHFAGEVMDMDGNRIDKLLITKKKPVVPHDQTAP